MRRRVRNKLQTKGVRAATDGNAALDLRAPAPGYPASANVLGREFFANQIPASENTRTHWGRMLDLRRIDNAIQNAGNGYMRPMADMASESVALDGHTSGLLQKRLNRVAALDWTVDPAKGRGVDEGRAEEYAEFVREQLEQIPNFRDRLVDIEWGCFDGRALSEIGWRRLGREWQVMDLYWVHPRRISFGPQREFRVVDAWRDGGGFRAQGFAPDEYPYKFIQFRPRLFREYQEREGLAPRILYWTFFQRMGTRERLSLMEIYGKPWRIAKQVLDKDGRPVVAYDDATRKQAFEAINSLGNTSTASMPPGWEIQIEQPTSTGAAIGVHGDAIKDARECISKLILGNTATTDAVSTGLGSSVGDVHLSEEDLIIWADARRLSECLEDQLTDAIIIANFGAQWVTHAPHFRLRTEPPVDRDKEASRAKQALDMGIPLALEDVRERLGYREVRDDEPVLRLVQRPAGLAGLSPAPAIEIVYPSGEAPAAGELAPQPLDGFNLPGGGNPSDAGNPRTPPGSVAAPHLPEHATAADIEALADKMTEAGLVKCEHGRTNRCPMCGIERDRDFDMGADGEAEWKVAWKPIGKASKRGQTPPELEPETPPEPAPVQVSRAELLSQARRIADLLEVALIERP